MNAPCKLSRDIVLDLDTRNRVPLVDGRCNNWVLRNGEEERCGFALHAHLAEATPVNAVAPTGNKHYIYNLNYIFKQI